MTSIFSSQVHFNFATSTLSNVYQNRTQGNCSTKFLNGLKLIPALGAVVTGSALWATRKVACVAISLFSAPAQSQPAAKSHQVKQLTPHIPSKEELEKLTEEELHQPSHPRT